MTTKTDSDETRDMDDPYRQFMDTILNDRLMTFHLYLALQV